MRWHAHCTFKPSYFIRFLMAMVMANCNIMFRDKYRNECNFCHGFQTTHNYSPCVIHHAVQKDRKFLLCFFYMRFFYRLFVFCKLMGIISHNGNYIVCKVQTYIFQLTQTTISCKLINFENRQSQWQFQLFYLNITTNKDTNNDNFDRLVFYANSNNNVTQNNVFWSTTKKYIYDRNYKIHLSRPYITNLQWQWMIPVWKHSNSHYNPTIISNYCYIIVIQHFTISHHTHFYVATSKLFKKKLLLILQFVAQPFIINGMLSALNRNELKNYFNF